MGSNIKVVLFYRERPGMVNKVSGSWTTRYPNCPYEVLFELGLDWGELSPACMYGLI